MRKKTSYNYRSNSFSAEKCYNLKKRQRTLRERLDDLAPASDANLISKAILRLGRFDKINNGDLILIEYKDDTKPPLLAKLNGILITTKGIKSLADVVIELIHPHKIIELEEGKYTRFSIDRKTVTESLLNDSLEFYLGSLAAKRCANKYGSYVNINYPHLSL